MKKLILTLLCLFPLVAYANSSWETIKAPEQGLDLMRLSTPHGWIVTYDDHARGIAYVPDEKHEWKIDNSKYIKPPATPLIKAITFFISIISIFGFCFCFIKIFTI